MTCGGYEIRISPVASAAGNFCVDIVDTVGFQCCLASIQIVVGDQIAVVFLGCNTGMGGGDVTTGAKADDSAIVDIAGAGAVNDLLGRGSVLQSAVIHNDMAVGGITQQVGCVFLGAAYDSAAHDIHSTGVDLNVAANDTGAGERTAADGASVDVHNGRLVTGVDIAALVGRAVSNVGAFVNVQKTATGYADVAAVCRHAVCPAAAVNINGRLVGYAV